MTRPATSTRCAPRKDGAVSEGFPEHDPVVAPDEDDRSREVAACDRLCDDCVDPGEARGRKSGGGRLCQRRSHQQGDHVFSRRRPVKSRPPEIAITIPNARARVVWRKITAPVANMIE